MEECYGFYQQNLIFLSVKFTNGDGLKYKKIQNI